MGKDSIVSFVYVGVVLCLPQISEISYSNYFSRSSFLCWSSKSWSLFYSEGFYISIVMIYTLMSFNLCLSFLYCSISLCFLFKFSSTFLFMSYFNLSCFSQICTSLHLSLSILSFISSKPSAFSELFGFIHFSISKSILVCEHSLLTSYAQMSLSSMNLYLYPGNLG